ncbi:hypothetical protein LZQ00_17330 [Sphingobacterium sp. SRCM116780]|uniref:hypothetical protein n=1 Tax=Sphingobacterium sp. SRCM116780 TaxID=2907623 RepID=UPI001F4739E2|nr:hypothetical protein [Sphingobacterium sp. SRCM116780]UIR56013.1 hypothetical protein LZQ00_17330 [Sphingobacterium sp. SRCM116780]
MSTNRNHLIAKNTFFLYFRMLFTLGVSLYSSRVVLNTLGVQDFGIYNVVGGIVAMFAFLNSSLAAATQRFLTYEKGKKDTAQLFKVFNISISIHLLIAGIVLILGETVGLWFVCNKLVIPAERMDAALWVYHFSILASSIGVLNAPYVAVVIANERMSIFAYISIVEVLLRLAIVFLLLVFAMDKLKLYSILTFSVTIIIIFLYQYTCRINFKESRIKRLLWDKKLFKEMAIFAGWVMNGNLAVVGYTQGLNILLNIFFGPAANAARGVAVQVQNAINGFSSSFQTSLNPQITKSYAIDDLNYMHKLIFLSSKVSLFLLLAISLPIMLNTHFVLYLWLKQVPDHTIDFVQLTMITSIIGTLGQPLIVAIHATNTLKKFQLWEGTVLLLIVPISYLLLKLGYPAETVFIVHLIISVIAQVVRITIVAPIIGMSQKDYYVKVVLRILYVLPFCIAIPYLISKNFEQGWINLIFSGVATGLTIILFFYMFGLDNSEKQYAKVYFSKLLSKFNSN